MSEADFQQELLICSWQPNSAFPPTPHEKFFHAAKRIVVDQKAEVVIFERCHWPNRFWSLRPQRRFTCPLSDIVRVHEDHENLYYKVKLLKKYGKRYTIETTTGTANVSEGMENCEILIKTLRAHCNGESRMLISPNVWNALMLIFIPLVFLAIWLFLEFVE